MFLLLISATLSLTPTQMFDKCLWGMYPTTNTSNNICRPNLQGVVSGSGLTLETVNPQVGTESWSAGGTGHVNFPSSVDDIAASVNRTICGWFKVSDTDTSSHIMASRDTNAIAIRTTTPVMT